LITDGLGVGTIADNDPVPSVSISSVAQNEGNTLGATTSFNFTVNLSQVSGQQVTVSYQTADGTALSSNDYVAAAGLLTFSPGVTGLPVTVLVNQDTTYEPDQSFTVGLFGASNATVSGPTGTGTGLIINDDPLPTVQFSSAGQSVSAGASVSVAVSLS